MGKLTADFQYFWDLCLVIVRFWWDLIWWHVGYLALCQAPWNLCPGNLSPQFHQRSELDCVIVSWYIKFVLRIFHHNFITGRSLFLYQYCDMWIGVFEQVEVWWPFTLFLGFSGYGSCALLMPPLHPSCHQNPQQRGSICCSTTSLSMQPSIRHYTSLVCAWAGSLQARVYFSRVNPYLLHSVSTPWFQGINNNIWKHSFISMTRKEMISQLVVLGFITVPRWKLWRCPGWE